MPASTPTPAPQPAGWSFANVRVYTGEIEAGLLLYGNLINNTGSAQELFFITGTFYDAQGQAIADEESTYDYWPVEFIPPGARVPFELTVDGIQSTNNFDLRVDAEPSGEAPRQDFEFSDLYQETMEYGYCVGGTLRNPGGQLEDYLVIVAVLYDNQDQVVSFGEYYPYYDEVFGD